MASSGCLGGGVEEECMDAAIHAGDGQQTSAAALLRMVRSGEDLKTHRRQVEQRQRVAQHGGRCVIVAVIDGKYAE